MGLYKHEKNALLLKSDIVTLLFRSRIKDNKKLGVEFLKKKIHSMYTEQDPKYKLDTFIQSIAPVNEKWVKVPDILFPNFFLLFNIDFTDYNFLSFRDFIKCF